MRRLCIAGGLSAAMLGLGVPANAAGPSTIVPGSGTQHALAVSVEGGHVLARACRSGAACSAAGGEKFAVPSDATVSKASVSAITLAGDKGIALVRVPLTSGGAWVLLVAASDAKESPRADKKLSGTVEVPKGKVDGERYRRVLLQEKSPNGTRLVIGKSYENATVCGRPAVIAARELDAADMSWRTSHARSLTPEAMKGATAVTARGVEGPFPTDAPRLLTATVASSAVGRSRSGMTDGDLATRWAEKRPGAGRGELISMNGSEEVGVTGFDIVLRPTGDGAPRGAAPKTFFIATGSDVFHVTMPEDAWQEDPGKRYRIQLPRVIKSDCFAVVLDEAHLGEDRDEVGLVELRARTELDGKSHAELAEMLRGDHQHADAARALLARSGKPAVKAVMAAYDNLDRRGRGRAIEVVEAGSCSDTAAFYVDRLLGRGVDLKEFEPDLDPLAQRARANLRGCRGAATVALTETLSSEAPGKRRVIAARELADVAPAAAVGAILEVLEDGSTAPGESGAKDDVRRGLRRALSTAAKHKRAHRAVQDVLAASTFAKLSLVKRIDLLRALGKTIAAHQPAAGAALASLNRAEPTFRTLYLVLPPAAHLARAGDEPATKLLRNSLSAHRSPHIRARAAAVAGGIPGLGKALEGALVDKSPRVREAALLGMTAAGQIPPAAMSRVTKLLATDKWTYVRIGAAQALAREPAGAQAAEAALIAALEDKSNKVRRAVLRALGDRKAQTAGEKIHDIADNAKEVVSVRSAAVAALGSLCRSESVEVLYKLALRAGYQQLPYDQPIGLAALAALGELKPPDLAERLAPLTKKNERVPRVIRSIARDVVSRPGSCK